MCVARAQTRGQAGASATGVSARGTTDTTSTLASPVRSRRTTSTTSITTTTTTSSSSSTTSSSSSSSAGLLVLWVHGLAAHGAGVVGLKALQPLTQAARVEHVATRQTATGVEVLEADGARAAGGFTLLGRGGWEAAFHVTRDAHEVLVREQFAGGVPSW